MNANSRNNSQSKHHLTSKGMNSMSSERVTKKTEIKTENIDEEIADAYAPEV